MAFRHWALLSLVLLIPAVASAQGTSQGASTQGASTQDSSGSDGYVFKSEVSLARLDVQVLDSRNQAVTGLRKEDFVLTEGGQRKEIRQFASEDMPMDIVLLLDVSGSMKPHVERIASAASTALQVLGDDDRVAIMVFDRQTRLRLPLRQSLEAVENELNNLLSHEGFNGGTDVLRGISDAALYLRRDGRREARKAIVILTDDMTERSRDTNAAIDALQRGDIVLSGLMAPDAMGVQRYPSSTGGGNWPSGGGGGWPSGGGLGGIILGRRGPWGRGPMGGGGGPVITGSRIEPFGTPEVARQTGGDSIPVDDAGALEMTLQRLRQRYALYYHASEGDTAARVSVHLTEATRRRAYDPQIRFRRVSATGEAFPGSEPVQVSRGRAPVSDTADPQSGKDDQDGWRQAPANGEDRPVFRRRRPAVSDDGSRGGGPLVVQDRPQPRDEDLDGPPPPSRTGSQGTYSTGSSAPGSSSAGAPSSTTTRSNGTSTKESEEKGGWRKADEPANEGGGWRRVKPGEKP
jgi:VWFA-related protein